MKKYFVAQANSTAQAFVARADHYDSKQDLTQLHPEWIILDQSDSYQYACAKRDEVNSQ